jgi:hypothetical protein
MSSTAAAADDDFDQTEHTPAAPGAGTPAASPAVIEGASKGLDERLSIFNEARVTVQSMANDLLDGIDEAIQQAKERLVQLQVKRDMVVGATSQLKVGPEEPSLLHRANGKTTRLREDGTGADESPAPPGVKWLRGKRERGGVPGKLPAFHPTKLREMPGRDAKPGKGDKRSLPARILEHLTAFPKSANKDVAGALDLPLSKISTNMNSLKRAGRVKRHGSGKAVTWSAA